MGHRQRVAGQAERLHVNSRYENAGGDPDEALAIPLPPVQIVDLRQELRAGNRSIFSRALDTAVTETLERGEQAILFLNRRGTSSFVICRDCGHTLACPRCDLPLTYHRPRHDSDLPPVWVSRSAACSFARSVDQSGSSISGWARKKSKRKCAALARRARHALGRDTTAGKDTHEELLARFINQEVGHPDRHADDRQGSGSAPGDAGRRDFRRCCLGLARFSHR